MPVGHQVSKLPLQADLMNPNETCYKSSPTAIQNGRAFLFWSHRDRYPLRRTTKVKVSDVLSTARDRGAGLSVHR